MDIFARGGGLDNPSFLIFFPGPRVECEKIKKFKNRCKHGKLKATVKSSMPEGVRVNIRNNDEVSFLVINQRGKGKVTFPNQGNEPHKVSIEVCPERTCTLPGCSGDKCKG